MNKIVLEDDVSRVYFSCLVGNVMQKVLFDTGSTNTLITLELANYLGIKQAVGSASQIRLAGDTIKVAPVVVPNITLGDITINDVRVLTGISERKWRGIVILGLNVLNHFEYTIKRNSDGGGFINLELNEYAVKQNTDRDRFNHLIAYNPKTRKNEYMVIEDEN